MNLFFELYLHLCFCDIIKRIKANEKNFNKHEIVFELYLYKKNVKKLLIFRKESGFHKVIIIKYTMIIKNISLLLV